MAYHHVLRLEVRHGQVVAHLRQYPQHHGQVVAHLRQYPQHHGQAAAHLRQYPQHHGQAAAHLQQCPQHHGQAAVHLRQYPQHHGQVAVHLRQYPQHHGQVAVHSEAEVRLLVQKQYLPHRLLAHLAAAEVRLLHLLQEHSRQPIQLQHLSQLHVTPQMPHPQFCHQPKHHHMLAEQRLDQLAIHLLACPSLEPDQS